MKAMSENEKTTVQAAPASRMNMRREARNQLVFLSAQFLLGMAVNLIGQPSETTGAARAVSTVLLGLHVVVAIGLAAGTVMVIRAARGGGKRPRQLARSGAVLIGLTVIAGVMTVMTKNNWWSYTMAAGFIASMLLYGSLLVRAQSLAPQPALAEAAFAVLAPGGRAVVVGMMPSDSRIALPASLLRHGRSMAGSVMGEVRTRQDIPAYLRMAASGRLAADDLATAVMPLDQVNEAFSHAAARHGIRTMIEF